MVTIKWPSRYALSIGGKLIQFTSAGTLTTNDEEVIEYLSSDSKFVVEWSIAKKEIKNEKKKDVKATKEVEIPVQLDELSSSFEEKFGKKVPVNKKNDEEWIAKKLAE